MHQFSGSTIEEALQLATAELGRDITVVRARRVTSKRTLGLGSKVRFEVDVLSGAQATVGVDLGGDAAPTGEFDGVLAGLIDNIERLEADQPSRAGRSHTGQANAGGAHQGLDYADDDDEAPLASRYGFGAADLAPSPLGYGPNRRRPLDARTDHGIDLRPTTSASNPTLGGGGSVRSEVDDEVLAALADRPLARAGDTTPPRVRLARTPTDQQDLAPPRPVRPVASPTLDTVARPGDPLARAARRAAERAAQHRSAELRSGLSGQPGFGQSSVGADYDGNAVERVLADHLAVERQQVELIAAQRREAQRREAQRLESLCLENERLDDERQEFEARQHQARQQAEEQAARQQAERAEREFERELAEQVRAAQLDELTQLERIEQERLASQRLLVDRVEAERRLTERVRIEMAEAERLAAERQTAEHLLAERLEVERQLEQRRRAEQVERDHQEQLRLEQDRLEQVRLETARLEQLRLEQLRLETASLELARVEAERADREAERAERVERLREEKLLTHERARADLDRALEKRRVAGRGGQDLLGRPDTVAFAEEPRQGGTDQEAAEADLESWLLQSSCQVSYEPARATIPSGTQAERPNLVETALVEPTLIELAFVEPVFVKPEQHEPVWIAAEWVDIDDPGRRGWTMVSDVNGDLPVLEAEVEFEGQVVLTLTDADADAGPGEPSLAIARARKSRRRLRDLQRWGTRPAGEGLGVGVAGSTAIASASPADGNRSAPASVELALPSAAPDTLAAKASAGLLRAPVRPRGVAERPSLATTQPTALAQPDAAARHDAIHLHDDGVTLDLTVGGAPQWSLEHLAAVGMPQLAVEALAELELGSDADWMSAVELFIRTNVPAPVSRPSDTPGVFLSGTGRSSATAMVQAGLLGFRPGYIFVDGQLRLASSIELMLAIRSCLPR